MSPAELRLRQLASQKGLRYVTFRGNVNAPTCVVGEAPGADEDMAGLPFVGKSGQELDRMLAEAGYFSGDFWLTNPFKLRPPNNDLDRIGELGIPVEAYLEQFFEELYAYKPTVIVACGATPLKILCPQVCAKRDGEAKIGLWRGSLLSSHKLPWPHYVIPMYHPAFILREWSERQIAVFCLARACEEVAYFRRNGRLNPLPERQLIVSPTFGDAVDYLTECLDKKLRVSIDIEMWMRRFPYTVAVAKSALSAISFSLVDYESKHLVRIWRLLDSIFGQNPQVGQNYLGFDSHWVEAIGFTASPRLVEDTMVRHHVLWPEFEHKLQFQTFQYTREPYYKDEGKFWKPSEGIDKLMRYNAKDAAVTYEIFERQEEEFAERPHLKAFYENYEMPLARHFFNIEQRGVMVDKDRLEEVRVYIKKELNNGCVAIQNIVGRPVGPDKPTCDALGKDAFNLGSPKQILDVFKVLKLKVPKTKTPNGWKENTGEEAIQKMFAKTGHPILKEILRVRELNKMLGTYINVKLANDILYTSYVVTGTVTGRRASRTNVFGLGTNLQNQPKHSELGRRFRRCLVARPGHIFVQCDQKGAEDWIVQAIIVDTGGPTFGLDELRSGINRHKKLAAFLFSKQEAQIDKSGGEYFLGKKTRHSGNYNVQAPTMSSALAKEGYMVPEAFCAWLLQKFHEAEPGIKANFHAYVEHELTNKHMLRTPLGRERYFLSLRNYSDNSSVFRDAYAYIPQSTVGDNTGLGICYCEDHRRPEWNLYENGVLLDGHDAITLEVPDTDEDILDAIQVLTNAFDRELKFPAGTTIKIPIEVEVGYDLLKMTPCEHSTKAGLNLMLNSLRSAPRVPGIIISGQQPQSSLQV